MFTRATTLFVNTVLVLLVVQVGLHVLSEEVQPPPPHNVHVDKWLLTWIPAADHADVTYFVRLQRFDTKEWENVPQCTNTTLYSCNISFIKDETENDCVRLRVHAQRHGLTSKAVEACSKQGNSCSPEVNLTARPGSLTVYLSNNNKLAEDHGDHVKHRIYYGKAGEALETYRDTVSSVSIDNLEEGQRYCVKVIYIAYKKITGVGSCMQCETIPKTSHPTPTKVIVGVVFGVLFLVAVICAAAYVFIFQYEKIKKCLRPPCQIPEHFLIRSSNEHHILDHSSAETHCDAITFVE